MLTVGQKPKSESGRGRRWLGVGLALLCGLVGISALNEWNDRDETIAMKREEMVRTQLEARGITDPLVLDAMGKVPRHLFVPESFQQDAYADHPLSIGLGQTISQPFIVAAMSALIEPKPGMKVLEIGTGSGYQAAILSAMGLRVFSIEIHEPLANQARMLLKALGYEGVTVRSGDGYQGWPEEAPFDAILVTAAPPEVPGPLLEQVVMGGRLVIPVGNEEQELKVLELGPEGWVERAVFEVRFVPMTGRAQRDGLEE